MADSPTTDLPAGPPQPAPVPRRWHDVKSFAAAHAEEREMRPAVLKRRRLLFLLGTALALLGAIAGALSWYRPVAAPYFIPLWITEYESPLLPVSAQAEPDREALRAGKYFARTDDNAFASQERHLLVQELSDLEGLRRNDALVLYLSAFARGTQGGEVSVFPADVNPDVTQTGVPLRRVLAALAACPARKKLLVLDVMRPLADPRLGILENNVASLVHDEVQKTLESVKDPASLGLILCACAPGQMSLASEDLGRTVFSFYFEQGLRGWADGYNTWNDRNGRVSVGELAEFVRARVDRWALNNRGVRQTPILLGVGRDFTLRALVHGRPEPRLSLPDVDKYPAWLLAAWKLRDTWLSDDSASVDPRLFNQLQATILRAEAQWRGGVDPSRVQNALAERIDFFTNLRNLAEAEVPRPQPRSLAPAFIHGQKPDPAVEMSLKELLRIVEQQTHELKPDDAAKAQEKLASGFLDKLKNKAHFDLASAVMEIIAADVNPTPEKVRFLNHLLELQQPKPQYMETNFLRRLAGMTSELGPEPWPASTVHRALAVVQRAGQALYRPRAVPWVKRLMQQAAQRLHDGEVLLFARGYAPIARADEWLAQAADDFDLVLSFEASIRDGLRARDQAFALLPAYLPYLEQNPHQERAWLAAVRAAQELNVVLAPPAETEVLSSQRLRQHVDRIRQQAEVVTFLLRDLNRPFTTANARLLIEQSRSPEATVALSGALDAHLATPFLTAEDRSALWQAARELRHRLIASTFQTDATEDEEFQPTLRLGDYERERAHEERTQRQLALLRARTEIAILEMGGLKSADINQLRAALDKPNLPALGNALQTALAEQLPEQIEHTADLRERDRLSRFVPPFDVLASVDNPATNPTVQLRRLDYLADLAWLYDYFRYLGSDLGKSEFNTDTVVQLQPYAGTAPRTTLQIDGMLQVPGLSVSNPTAACTLRLTLVTKPESKTSVQARVVTADDDWLQVYPDLAGLTSLATPGQSIRSCSLPLTITLKPGADLSRTPRPKGFLVEISVNGRTYHYPVAIPTLPLPLTERLEVLLSADPAAPNAPISDLRLRPSPIHQPYFVFIRNTTPASRAVLVQLHTGGAALKGGEAKVDIKSDSWQRVSFGAPPAQIAAPLPVLQSPLQLSLLDAADPGKILDQKKIAVGIASPREYVRITDIRFNPSSPANGGKNQLAVKLRATAPLTGPPCTVELVLPPERIPGFIAAKDGSFRGILPPSGDELTLYAHNIQRQEGSPEQGYVYLTVDGQPRAFIFRTTFARQGAPTFPTEDDRPAVRLAASKYARSTAQFPVRIEVDNPPPQASLLLRLGRDADGVFQADIVEKRAGVRDRILGFSPQGADGSLLFQATDQDWNIPLDVTGIRGARDLDVELFASGRPVTSARLRVTFDDSPPTGVQFIGVPGQVNKNAPLSVAATGADLESGIAKVTFFLGKPADGKIPPQAVTLAAAPSPNDGQTWTAQLSLTALPKGAAEIGVEFTNGAGLSTVATTSVNLLDGDPPRGGPGRIRGVVLEGGRPQANLEVALADEKGKDIDKKKTGADGTFLFENLAPGKYKVTSTKAITDRRASAEADVLPGQTVQVTVNLYR